MKVSAPSLSFPAFSLSLPFVPLACLIFPSSNWTLFLTKAENTYGGSMYLTVPWGMSLITLGASPTVESCSMLAEFVCWILIFQAEMVLSQCDHRGEYHCIPGGLLTSRFRVWYPRNDTQVSMIVGRAKYQLIFFLCFWVLSTEWITVPGRYLSLLIKWINF